MGQASGGMTNDQDRICPCMLGENKEQNNDDKWISCEGCSFWFHHSCALLSDSEYDEIIKTKEKWFCCSPECQDKMLKDLEKVENADHNELDYLKSQMLNDESDTNEYSPCKFCKKTFTNCQEMEIHCNLHKKLTIKIKKKSMIRTGHQSKVNDCLDDINQTVQIEKPNHPTRNRIPRKCKQTEPNPTSQENLHTNDLIEFLRIVEEDYTEFNDLADNLNSNQNHSKSMAQRTKCDQEFVCPHCENSTKKYKGANGLKIHISRKHSNELSKTKIEDSTNDSNQQIGDLTTKSEIRGKCPFCTEECTKSYQIPQGLKIHCRRMHKNEDIDTYLNSLNNNNFDNFVDELTLFETKLSHHQTHS